MQREVNSEAISRLVDACHTTGNPKLVYLSSDAVFGDTAGPHEEAGVPEPETRRDDLLSYALTKAEGERHVLSYKEGIVVRTSQVNGVNPNGAISRRLHFVLEQLRDGQPVDRFSDMKISPTLRDNLTQCLVEVCRSSFKFRGCLHIAGSEITSPLSYCQRLAETFGYERDLVRGTSRLSSPTTSSLPGDASLSVKSTQTQLRTPLLGVDEQIRRIYRASELRAN